MKKLLIAAISVFILTNLALARSTQQNIDNLRQQQAQKQQKLEQDKQKLEQDKQELEKLNEALKTAEAAQSKEKRKAAEDLFNKRFKAFKLVNLDHVLYDYMIGELIKNPNWDIIDISAGGNSMYIKSTSHLQGERVYVAGRYDTISGDPLTYKKVLEWHKNPTKYEQAKKLLAMERSVESYVNGFRGKVSHGTRYMPLLKRIHNLECKEVKIYHSKAPANSYVYQPRYKVYYKIDDELIFAKCFQEHITEPIDLYQGPTILSEYAVGYYEVEDPTYLYQYKPFGDNPYNRHINYPLRIWSKPEVKSVKRTYPFEAFAEETSDEPNVKNVKKTVPIETLPLQHLKTFRLEDYK